MKKGFAYVPANQLAAIVTGQFRARLSKVGSCPRPELLPSHPRGTLLRSSSLPLSACRSPQAPSGASSRLPPPVAPLFSALQPLPSHCRLVCFPFSAASLLEAADVMLIPQTYFPISCPQELAVLARKYVQLMGPDEAHRLTPIVETLSTRCRPPPPPAHSPLVVFRPLRPSRCPPPSPCPLPSFPPASSAASEHRPHLCVHAGSRGNRMTPREGARGTR